MFFFHLGSFFIVVNILYISEFSSVLNKSNLLFSVISEIIGHKTNYNCSACVFRLYQQAAEILDYNIEIRNKKNGKREKKQNKKVES